MATLGRYIGQIFLISFLLLFVLLQTYCGPKIMPQDACGFAQNSLGQRISWKQSLPVKIHIDSKYPQEMRQPLNNAIATLEAAVNNKKLFQIVGESNKAGAHDNTNIIYWVSSWDQTSPASQKEQANTMAWWADNQMIENDIYINASQAMFSLSTDPAPNQQQIDMESLMLHEFGHVLGLKHIDAETDVPTSIMNKNLKFTQIRRTLYPIDIADLKCEY